MAANAKHYFPEGVRYDAPLSHDAVVLRGSVAALDLARHYRVSLPTLVDMNLAWLPPVQRGARPVPGGTTVWLPAGTIARVPRQPTAGYAAL